MTSSLLEKEVPIFFSEEELSRVDARGVPEHIAIIMDGNRRWAKNRGISSLRGHWQGAETLSRVVRAAAALGIQTLTVFGFSTENWNRSSLEVKALMHLFKEQLLQQKPMMVREGVRFHAIGNLSLLPEDVQSAIFETKEATKEGSKIDLVVALNYGSRDEIKRAVQSIAQDCLEEKLSIDKISEKLIASYLDTASWKDPDLLIRPSGEQRLSNFLLWQISYTEIVVTDILWPDFTEKDLLAAVMEYQKRELRIGR